MILHPFWQQLHLLPDSLEQVKEGLLPYYRDIARSHQCSLSTVLRHVKGMIAAKDRILNLLARMEPSDRVREFILLGDICQLSMEFIWDYWWVLPPVVRTTIAEAEFCHVGTDALTFSEFGRLALIAVLERRNVFTRQRRYIQGFLTALTEALLEDRLKSMTR